MTKSYFMRGLSSLNEWLQFVRVQNMTKSKNFSQISYVAKIQLSNQTVFVLQGDQNHFLAKEMAITLKRCTSDP